MLREAFSERLEGCVSQPFQCHRTTYSGPDHYDCAHDAHQRADKQEGIGVVISLGPEPFSKSAGEDALDGRHMSGLCRSQVRVDVGRLHAREPRPRVAAKPAELLGHCARLANEGCTERVQGCDVRWLVEQSLAERLGALGVGSEERRLFRWEVIEEGARGDVGGLGDVLHGHMSKAALGDQAEGDASDGPARREFLALTQGGPLLVDGEDVGDQRHALSVILQSPRYCLFINSTQTVSSREDLSPPS